MSGVAVPHKLPPVTPASARRHVAKRNRTTSKEHSGRRSNFSSSQAQWVPMPPEGSPPPSAQRSPPGPWGRSTCSQWQFKERGAKNVSNTAPVSRECSPPVSRECSPPSSANFLRLGASELKWGNLESPRPLSPLARRGPPAASLEGLAAGLHKGALHMATIRSDASTSASTYASESAATFTDTFSSNCSSRRGSLTSEPSVLSTAIAEAYAVDRPAEQETAPKLPNGPPPLREITLSRLLLRRCRNAANQNLVVQTAREERRIRELGETKIYDLYHWDKVIQEDGDGGKVVVCRAKSSKDSSPTSPRSSRGQEFVMKMCRKQSIKTEGMEKQFRKVQHRMLNFPLHPGVMPLHEVLEDDHCLYTVMEKADGGPLFSSLLDEYPDGVIPAKVVKRITRQILSSLAHVHKYGMLHRDIKPDNIVAHHGNPMLIDFDHADPDWNASEHKRVESFYGTLRFSAPEAFRGYFSQQSDLYSVGVLLYLLMAGKLPRDDSILKPSKPTAGCQKWSEEVYTNLLREPGVDWQCDPWPNDPTCTDFCQWLLHFYPQSRPTCAEEALCHPWLEHENDDDDGEGADNAVAANATAE